MTQPTLFTERLALVPLAEEHLDFELELDSDPDVMRYIDGRASSRAEVVQAHERRIAAAHSVPGLGFWVGFTEGRSGNIASATLVLDPGRLAQHWAASSPAVAVKSGP